MAGLVTSSQGADGATNVLAKIHVVQLVNGDPLILCDFVEAVIASQGPPLCQQRTRDTTTNESKVLNVAVEASYFAEP